MSEFIASGKIIDLIFLLIIIAASYYFIEQAGKGKYRKIRYIAAMGFLEEIVGRAAEMGRIVHYSPGDFATITGSVAPMTIAGLSIMKNLVGLCAQYDVKFVGTTGIPDVYPLMYDMVREAYIEAGKPEQFDSEESVRFTSRTQQVDSATVIEILNREKAAGTVLVGAYGGGTLSILGGAHLADCMIIYGTARTTNIAWGAAFADSVLISSEIYAAGAQASKNPEMVGSITAEEVGKWITVGLLLLGVILTAIGSGSIITNFLKM